MNFLNLKKNMYKNPATNIIVNGERQYFFPNIRQVYLFLLILFSVVLGALVGTVARTEKKNYRALKGEIILSLLETA